MWLRQKQQRLVSFGNCSMQRLRNHLLISTDMKFCDISWLEFNVTWKSFVWINVMIKLSTWHYCDKVDYLACYCKQGVFRSALYTNTQTHKHTIWHNSSEVPTIPANKRGKVFHTVQICNVLHVSNYFKIDKNVRVCEKEF